MMLKCNNCGSVWEEVNLIQGRCYPCKCGWGAGIITTSVKVGGFKKPLVLEDLAPEGPIRCNSAREVDRECEKRGVFLAKERKPKGKIYGR